MSFFALKNPRIPLRDLQPGSTKFLIRITDPELFQRDGLVLTGDITVEAEVTQMGDDLLLQVEAMSGAEIICDRCGENYHSQLTGEVKTLFSRDQEECAEQDEIKYLSPSEREIVILEEIRDALATAVPAKLLCGEDCKGLCPQCGANLNSENCKCDKGETDSRWDTLKQINFENDEK